MYTIKFFKLGVTRKFSFFDIDIKNYYDLLGHVLHWTDCVSHQLILANFFYLIIYEKQTERCGKYRSTESYITGPIKTPVLFYISVLYVFTIYYLKKCSLSLLNYVRLKMRQLKFRLSPAGISRTLD